jgi:hypothetical protein
MGEWEYLIIYIQMTNISFIKAETLFRDLTRTHELFIEKHSAFQMLCILYTNKLPDWNKMNRRECVLYGKEVECVYRHSRRNGQFNY